MEFIREGGKPCLQYQQNNACNCISHISITMIKQGDQKQLEEGKVCFQPKSSRGRAHKDKGSKKLRNDTSTTHRNQEASKKYDEYRALSSNDILHPAKLQLLQGCMNCTNSTTNWRTGEDFTYMSLQWTFLIQSTSMSLLFLSSNIRERHS